MQLRRANDVIRVVGFDPSLRNWGIAIATLVPATLELSVQKLDVTRAVVNKGKQVRQNSQDLDVAQQLAEAAVNAAQGAQAIFVEVPVGSQNARSMASYGVCVGVLGALRAQGIPFFEVNPEEVKLATGLTAKASKAEMIAWATQKYPDAGWPLHNGALNAGLAEHMADAIAAIEAGIKSKPFQQALSFITKQAI